MICLGIFGLALMTVLPFLLAVSVKHPKVRLPEVDPPRELGTKLQIEVVVPAHNEEHQILATLQRIEAASDLAQQTYSLVSVTKAMGADGCSDRTLELVMAEGQTRILSTPAPQGKWKTLNALVQSSRAHWVVFADAGVEWPADLLVRMIPWMLQPQVIGIAPAYRVKLPLKKSLLLDFYWKAERWLKHLENRVGGPVSVHGATVAYSRKELMNVLLVLERVHWLNDDVVIPLMMRFQNPNKLLYYAQDLAVFDADADPLEGDSPKEDLKKEFVRRDRIFHGNLQWIRLLFPRIFLLCPSVGFLALRRIARNFWVYWFLGIGLAVMGDLAPARWIFGSGLVMLFSPQVRRWGVSAWISLRAPWEVILRDPQKIISWK